jgi:tRNA C32,U32 (ribose-2'-O)-methylase TrmJ
MNSFLGRLESSLDARGYQAIYEKRQGSHRNIRSIFQRRLLTKTEVDTLQGVLTALLKQPCWPDAEALEGREGGGGAAATSA